MIQDFHSRIKTAANAIHHGNLQYGFRAFIDCILDTNNPEWYQQCISLVEEREQKSISEDDFYARIISYLQQLEERSTAISGENTLLEAANISRSYGAGKFALKNVSIKINAGEVIGLVGENGNGKTTLLRILAQELHYDQGSLFVSVPEEAQYDKRTQLIYIPQRTPTWYGSLYDNLKFTAANYGIKGSLNQLLVDMMIIRFGLWEYRKLNWSELSSGYKMRFELARTFLRKPKILLLDEPLGNLDVKSQQIILEDLKGLAQSPTNPIGIVLSSQQLFEVEKIADKILFLRKGEPEYYSEKEQKQEISFTILELESSATLEQVQSVFSKYPHLKISFNGGIYTLQLEEKNAFKTLLKELADSEIEIIYLRDISHSTRRFFI
jgi:ABC-2 type transport system ATP-binding protein